jgi:hypothetical protein
MNNITLTPLERQTLINQYEILKHLTDSDHEKEHYDEIIEILHDGYSIFYGDAVQVFDGMDEETCKFVLDVLDMYRAIEDYKGNNPKDEEVHKHHWSTFQGFDGNNETMLMAFTRFLIEKQRKFTEQVKHKDKVDSWNSHAQVCDTYEPMVKKWRSLQHQHGLKRDAVLAILAASGR